MVLILISALYFYSNLLSEVVSPIVAHKGQLLTALKTIDDEEARMVRLYAAGKISEDIWNSLWAEWQDRRAKIRITLSSLEQQKHTHISNLDSALNIIAEVGMVYNSLERSNQKELLRHMVERVIIDSVGNIQLELRAPFVYLCEISHQINDKGQDGPLPVNTKTDRFPIGLSVGACSDTVYESWENCTQFEHPNSLNTLDFLHCITFPQRANLLRFTNSDMVLANR